MPGITDRRAADAGASERLRVLLRDIYAAAGGSHPDLAEYDRVMAANRRTAVLLAPERFATNPPGAEHVESADRPATDQGRARAPAPPRHTVTQEETSDDRSEPRRQPSE